jgi:mannose/fructose-specific phosphotransferase system component IIA
MINIVVITHGEFGAYLIEAAEGIVGVQHEGLKSISVPQRMSLEKVQSVIEAVIAEMRSDDRSAPLDNSFAGPRPFEAPGGSAGAKEDGLLFLLDMLGGTPMNIVLPLVKDIPKSAVICGVNINMMTSAFAYRNSLDFDGLVTKILSDGRKAVCEVKSLLLKGR